MIVEGQEQLEDVLADIEMSGTPFQEWSFDWRVTSAKTEHGEGWFVQSSFERPDVDGATMPLSRGFGREWYVKSGASLERRLNEHAEEGYVYRELLSEDGGELVVLMERAVPRKGES